MNDQEKHEGAPSPLGPIDLGTSKPLGPIDLSAAHKSASDAEERNEQSAATPPFDPNTYGDPSAAASKTSADQGAASGSAEGAASASAEGPFPEDESSAAPAFDNNPYGDPNAPPPTAPAPPKQNGLGVAALVTGILSHVLNACCCLGFPLAVAAIVCAIFDRQKTGKMSGLALAGLILAILSLFSLVATLVYLLFVFTTIGEAAIGGSVLLSITPVF